MRKAREESVTPLVAAASGLVTRRQADPREVERIFEAALGLPEGERPAFVQAACGSDAALRAEVLSILGWEAGGAPPRPAGSGPPPGARVGPYEILRSLGRGGMGLVYRALHAGSGAEVALKTVSLPDARLLAGIRREIKALAQLRHPGIVRIVDEGVSDGIPWYAMELLEGTTLARWAAGAGPAPSGEEPGWWTSASGPDPAGAPRRAPAAHEVAAGGRLAEVLALVRALCAPLSYLHGEGLVHRDLKPDNVLVRPDGAPVLVDFGLSAAFGGEQGRDRLDAGGDVVGTASYMAPEQARGEVADARTDLYSLGCLLYELVVGHPPFAGRGVEATILAHQTETPRPPGALVAGVPPALDRLVMGLLARSPADRIGFADAVAARLGELGAPEPGTPAPLPRAYLYRAAQVGRDDVMSELVGEISRAGKGAGRIVLVGGEGGIGRTRLLTEAASDARTMGFQVLLGECLREEGVPLAALERPLEACADLCRQRGRETTDRVLGRRGRILATLDPALAELPGQDAYPEPAVLPPDAGRLRLLEALGGTLVALAGERPLLLALDDLQWADELTLALLEHLQGGEAPSRGALGRSRLLVLGSYRNDEVPRELARLLSREGVRRIDLALLDEGAVASMAGEMLALAPAPAGLVRSLRRQSEGNPYFVAEYLRAAVAEGHLRRDAEGRWSLGEGGEQGAGELPLPTSIRGLVSRRIARLGAGARSLVEAASILGGWMEIDLLFAVAALQPSELARAWTELLARQILETDPPGLLCRFVHASMKEVVGEALAPGRAAALHRAAATALDAGAAPDRGTGAELSAREAAAGRHWERAGEPDLARDRYEAGARRAIARSALDDAERLCRAFLGTPGVPERRHTRIRIELARSVLRPRGRYAEAEAELSGAFADARELGDDALAAEALLVLGAVLKEAGRLDEAGAPLEQALAEARRLGHARIEAMALANLGGVARELGRYGEARQWYALAAAAGDGLDGSGFHENLRNDVAILHTIEGRFDQARELYEESAARSAASGRRLEEGLATVNLGHLHRMLGRLQAARSSFEQAASAFQEVGTPVFESDVLANLAGLMVDLGHIKDARAISGRAEELLVRAGREPGAGLLETLGRIAWAGGDAPGAAACYERALLAASRLGDPLVHASVLGWRGELVAHEGRLDEAAALLEEALAIGRRVGSRWHLGVVERHLAGVALHREGAVAALRHLASACELLGGTRSLELALGHCLEVHARLAGGEATAGDLLVLPEALVASEALTSSSPLAGRLRAVRRALAARERGEVLVSGFHPQDLPPAVAMATRRPG